MRFLEPDLKLIAAVMPTNASISNIKIDLIYAAGDIDGADEYPAGTSDDDMQIVAKLGYRLNKLTLGHTEVTDAGIEHLKNMPIAEFRLAHVKGYSIKPGKITERSLDSIATFSELRQLELHGLDFTDEGLSRFFQQTEARLQYLTLENIPINGSCLSNLKKFPLVRLQLRHSLLGDNPLKIENLELLRDHPTLECLELVGLRDFSASDREQLSEKIGIRVVTTKNSCN